jgi:hypothetical protein
MEVVIVVGAGSTLSDAGGKPLKHRPPLDHGFFSQCEKLGYRELRIVKNYLISNYDIDPSSGEFDSLERMMAVVYADINNPLLSDEAVRSFRNIIRLFNRRIAESTNPLKANYNSNLYRIIAKKLSEGVEPRNISVITFNQDLQVEKAIQKLQSTAKYSKYGKLFSFPWCYGMTDPLAKLTSPPTGEDVFEVDRIAVGTLVTRRPPHRSQRALLTHWAPPLGIGVKTMHRLRMDDPHWRKVTCTDPFKTLPRHPTALAPSP